MSYLSDTAERCLVAVCAHLSMMTVRDENFAMWLGVAQEVLPHCRNSGSAFWDLRTAAERLVDAQGGSERDVARIHLQRITARYFAAAAGDRFDAWKNAKGRGA